MPLTLDSTRALRGEKRKWTLVVMGHGRVDYRQQALTQLDNLVGLYRQFDRRIMAFDGPEQERPAAEWEWVCTGERSGLTANMAQAIGALTDEDEWVFWLEEDFLVHDAPLDAMADTLDAFPHLANIVLLRQPWNAQEQRHGSVLPTITGGVTDRGGWLEHTAGFWLNPFVAHASLLRSLQPGVEESLTRQCRARGLSFGYWGGMDDPPRCEHIGVEGGMGSPGWLP